MFRGIFFILFSQVCAEELVYTPLYGQSISMVEATVKSLLVVVALVLLLIIWYRKILPNLQENMATKNIRIIERVYLDPATILYIVKIADTFQTILVSNKQTTLLGPVSKKALILPTPGQAVPVTEQFHKVLESIIKKGLPRAKKK
jgi:flagellar biogenesis protein FliO